MKYKFADIKKAYIEIAAFLESSCGVKVTSLENKIAEDLELWGDENFFILNEYCEKYKVDFRKFNYSEHFDSEADSVGIRYAFIIIIFFPFYILNGLYKTFFPKCKTSVFDYILPMIEEKKDLTFGDLITSKLKGEFCLRETTKIELLK